jgi:CBS domain-containing protein
MTSETAHSQRSSHPPNPLAGRVVEDFASVGILARPPDAPLDEVAWLMAENRVHAVRDSRRLPVGILSTLGIARAISGRD